MINEEIPIPGNIISASNYRLQVAIMAVRIYGRNAETMCEVYSAKWSRLNLRGAYRNSVRQCRKALNNYLEKERAAIYAWQLTNAKKSRKMAMISRN